MSGDGEILYYPQVRLRDLDAGAVIGYPRTETAYSYYAVPSFLIIGAQKCGTRELHTWLDAHPNLRGAPLECHFFNDVMNLDSEWTRYVFSPAFLLSKDEARLHSAPLHTFEKTPAYLDQRNRGRPVPELVRAMMPSGKFIALVRDPADRAYSAYQMGRTAQRTEGVFSEYLDKDFESLIEDRLARLEQLRDERLISIGHYAVHLDMWLEYFAREQLLIVVLEEFKRAPLFVMSRVLSFLNLPDFDYRPLITRNHRGLWVLKGRASKGDANPYEPMSARARALLDQHYEPHTRRLRQLAPQLDIPW